MFDMIEHAVFQTKITQYRIRKIRKAIEFLEFEEFHGHIEEVQFQDNS